jgi:hypothetical protein
MSRQTRRRHILGQTDLSVARRMSRRERQRKLVAAARERIQRFASAMNEYNARFE